MPERPVKRVPVALPQCLEAPFELLVQTPEEIAAGDRVAAGRRRLVEVKLPAQQRLQQGGDQRAREPVRGKHGEHDGQREGPE